MISHSKRSLRRGGIFALASLVSLGGAVAQTSASEDMGEDASVPEGRIVFSSDRDGDSEIYVVNADGTRLRQITRNRVDDSVPSWHPSRNKIVFSRRNANHIPDIWTKNLRTGKLRRITRSPKRVEWAPRYSPNGVWIVFAKELGKARDYRNKIVALRPRDGASVVVKASTIGAVQYLGGPMWSPDGSKIAYGVFPPEHIAMSDFVAGGGSTTVILRSDDSGEGNGCAAFESLGSVVLAPDGATLAYTAYHESDPGALCLLPLDGGEPEPLISGHNVPSPGSWSPQGEHLVGTVVSEGVPALVIVDVRTGAIEPLIADGESPDWIALPPAGGGD